MTARCAFATVSETSVTWPRSPNPHYEIVVEASGLIETWDRVGIARGLVEVAPRPVYLRQTPMTAPDEAIRKLAAGIEAHRSARPPAQPHAARPR